MGLGDGWNERSPGVAILRHRKRDDDQEAGDETANKSDEASGDGSISEETIRGMISQHNTKLGLREQIIAEINEHIDSLHIYGGRLERIWSESVRGSPRWWEVQTPIKNNGEKLEGATTRRNLHLDDHAQELGELKGLLKNLEPGNLHDTIQTMLTKGEQFIEAAKNRPIPPGETGFGNYIGAFSG